MKGCAVYEQNEPACQSGLRGGGGAVPVRQENPGDVGYGERLEQGFIGSEESP